MWSGHEKCHASGGPPSGYRKRSDRALTNRAAKAREIRAKSRREYRYWKSHLGGQEFWAGQTCQSPPPFRPTCSAQLRVIKHTRSFPHQTSRAAWFRNFINSPQSIMTNPRPLSRFKFCTWNVEGLYEPTKYDQLFQYMVSNDIMVLAMQETKATCPHSFLKRGFEVYLSGQADSPHHGVGFIVHPKARHLCSGFLGHSARVCSIEVAISPCPIMLVNVYAPSMVEDPEEDIARKAQFWNALESHYGSLPSHKMWFFLGDWNARVSPSQDPAARHIGPDAWDKRQAVADPERDNAEFLLSFLCSHDLFLPQTFGQPQARKRITYLEPTAVSNNYYCPQKTDWASLDYVAAQLRYKSKIHKCASNCQVSLSTRHFPVELTLEVPKFRSKPVRAPCPKLEFSSPKGNFRHSLDLQIHNRLSTVQISPPAPSKTMAIFTDGSCGLTQGHSRKGGWGFIVTAQVPTRVDPMYFDHFIDASFGPCAIATDLPKVPTNNLAEIQAVIEVLDWLIGYFSDNTVHFYLFMDSDYVLGLLEGRNYPGSNYPQIALLLTYWQTAVSLFHLTPLKVAAHVGIPGNERAHALALEGQTGMGWAGRFSVRPPAPLVNPEIEGAVISSEWGSFSLDQKSDFLLEVAAAAASEAFAHRRHEIKQPYISNSTFSLIETLSQLTQPHQVQQRRLLRNKIKKQARKDKKVWWNLKFFQDHRSAPSQQWRSVKQVRSKFIPKPTNIRDIRGNLRPRDARPEVFAEYLTSTVWARRPLPPLGVAMQFQPVIPATIGPVKFVELTRALSCLKVGKSPGPDGMQSELLKFSSLQFQSLFLSLLSDCFLGAMVPSSWKKSFVIMFLKSTSKPTTSLLNYRPISLTTSMYKVYAMILRQRLQPYVDPHLRYTQYGFRPHHSVSQPIHILRQLAQMHDRQTRPLHLVFLDWSRAFDSVTHDAIQHSLFSLGVPEQLVQAVLSLYTDPSFQVQEFGVTSQPRCQENGLRQGCPLSPYLFIAVTTTMFKYVEAEHLQRFGYIAPPLNKPVPVWDLQFADDTVLLANSAELANRLLHGVQRHGYLLGLELNPDKCEHLAFNSEKRVHFRTGDPMNFCKCCHCGGEEGVGPMVSLVHEVKYLGVKIESAGGNAKFFSDRISKATTIAKMLAPFFRSQLVSITFRLRVYQAIVQSILLYSLESVVPTPAQNTRLNSVYFRILRQIFNIKTPFYHRVVAASEDPCSNEFLHKLANSHGLDVLTPSQLAAERRQKLMGHILRHPETPEHGVCFNSAHSYRYLGNSNLRPGRPRPHWAELTLTESYRRLDILRRDGSPSLLSLGSPFFALPTSQEIENYHGAHLANWRHNLRVFRPVHQASLDRIIWRSVTGQQRSSGRI